MPQSMRKLNPPEKKGGGISHTSSGSRYQYDVTGISRLKSPFSFVSMVRHSGTTVLIIGILACAGGIPSSQTGFKRYEAVFKTPVQDLLEIGARALVQSSFDFELDPLRSNLNHIETFERSLSAGVLRKYARPRVRVVRGKILEGGVKVRLLIQPSTPGSTWSNVIIETVFRAYISRMGDKRQWIEWQSSGALEQELIDYIQAFIGSPVVVKKTIL